MFKYL